MTSAAEYVEKVFPKLDVMGDPFRLSVIPRVWAITDPKKHPWIVASNGHVMLAVDFWQIGGPHFEKEPGKPSAKIQDAIRKYIFEPSFAGCTLPLTAPAPWEPCKACNGGECECPTCDATHECGQCGGREKVRLLWTATEGGALVQSEYLEWIAVNCPGVLMALAGPGERVSFVFEHGVGCVMPAKAAITDADRALKVGP